MAIHNPLTLLWLFRRQLRSDVYVHTELYETYRIEVTERLAVRLPASPSLPALDD